MLTQDLTSHWKGEEFLSDGDLDLWGMNGINDVCSGETSVINGRT